MAFNKETLGLRIGEIRRRRGLSQMALAEQNEKSHLRNQKKSTLYGCFSFGSANEKLNLVRLRVTEGRG